MELFNLSSKIDTHLISDSFVTLVSGECNDNVEHAI